MLSICIMLIYYFSNLSRSIFSDLKCFSYNYLVKILHLFNNRRFAARIFVYIWDRQIKIGILFDWSVFYIFLFLGYISIYHTLWVFDWYITEHQCFCEPNFFGIVKNAYKIFKWFFFCIFYTYFRSYLQFWLKRCFTK